MDPKTVLTKAREIIADPKRWTKGDWMRLSRDDGQAQYCMLGAMRMVCFPSGVGLQEGGRDFGCAVDILRKNVPGDGIVAHFNDSPKTTHADVLAAFDRAIDSIREAE